MKRAARQAVTLRNLPPDLDRLVERRAREKHLSLNKAVISLLEEAAGVRESRGKRRVYHDLDALAGRWTAEEAAEFEALLADQRAVDEEVWR